MNDQASVDRLSPVTNEALIVTLNFGGLSSFLRKLTLFPVGSEMKKDDHGPVQGHRAQMTEYARKRPDE